MPRGKKPESLSVAARMPELDHSSDNFNPVESEVLDWLCKQPSIRGFIFYKVKSLGLIVHDKASNRWRGKDTPASKWRF